MTTNNKPPFFFPVTQSVDERLGDIFNFTWASYAGLRELWWQIRGFNGAHPNISVKEIEEKFVRRIPPPGGVDVRRMFLERSWEDHEQEFCKQILFEACTLYEGWCENVCEEVFPNASSAQKSKELQFPTTISNNGVCRGLGAVVDAANAARSTLMFQEFFPTIRLSSHNCWSHINEHVTAYRFFKECRNSLIHSNGYVTSKVMDCRNDLASVQALNGITFDSEFFIPVMQIGKKIEFAVSDIILFASVVRRIIFTLDAALSVSIRCENILERRLRELISTSTKWQILPGDRIKHEKRCHRMLAAARIPEPVSIQNVISWMQEKSLISPR